MGAALHFDTWVPNFGIQEYMTHTEETDAVFPHAYWFEDGYLHPGDAPGHGVDIDEELAAKYPYSRAYLPVNRLEDWHHVQLVSGRRWPSPLPLPHRQSPSTRPTRWPSPLRTLVPARRWRRRTGR